MTRGRIRTAAAAALVALLVGAGAYVGQTRLFPPMVVTAVFPSAHGIYPGDDVRIAGVKAGTVTGISPTGTRVTLTLRVDHGVRVPAEAKAVIVAQNLVAARFVQLAPGYTGGPLMTDGAVIPDDRTAVPVEWDEVKEQLNRLATDLGPGVDDGTSSLGRLIDSAAAAMAGNGSTASTGRCPTDSGPSPTRRAARRPSSSRHGRSRRPAPHTSTAPAPSPAIRAGRPT